jgi:hypothetical protein
MFCTTFSLMLAPTAPFLAYTTILPCSSHFAMRTTVSPLPKAEHKWA